MCYGTNNGLDHTGFDYDQMVSDDSYEAASRDHESYDEEDADDYDDGYMSMESDYSMRRLAAARQRHHQYRSMYTNCTYVVGNLEIVFLMGPNNETFDLDFLSSIQEVNNFGDGCLSILNQID